MTENRLSFHLKVVIIVEENGKGMPAVSISAGCWFPFPF
jgi:hypothetical protein